MQRVSLLVETDSVLVSERLAQVNTLVLEVLLDPTSSRLLTALAPVLVARTDEVRLPVIDHQLSKLGLQHRLGWVADNTCVALQGLLDARARTHGPSPAARRQQRRAALVLGSWLESAKSRSVPSAEPDVLEPSVRSRATLAELKLTGSEVSRTWGVVSSLHPNDFARAIEAADAAR
jgi:hypothetical protein